MGQKVHPLSLRLGYIKTWGSRWLVRKGYADLLHEDVRIRRFIKERLSFAGVSKVEIERAGDRARVTIYTAKPGVIIGRRGQEIDRLRDDLHELTGKDIYIDIKEIRLPQLDAQLIAENIALQIERRVSFRRAMKKAITATMGSGALGIKVGCSGRLGGAEIARREGYKEGKIPLHTFRADIDYGFCEVHTAYGLIGVKVWVYKGDVLKEGAVKDEEAEG